jgi:trehalose-phosphatase
MQYVFDHWDEIARSLKERPCVFFLDYDGTLSRIVDDPDAAVMTPRMRSILADMVAAGQDVAVVSGRELRDVAQRVGVRGITYVGSHGLDVSGPGISYHKPLPASYRKALDDILSVLRIRCRGISGAIVEDKGNVVTLHFRKVRREQEQDLRIAFHEATVRHLVRETVRVASGKKVLEVRPAFVWDKGKIVLWLLARYRFGGKERGVPLYIGDDQTDEDAFTALNGKGFTIHVGNRGRSAAQYFLLDTSDVYRFLRRQHKERQ